MARFILNKRYLFLIIVLLFGAFYIFNFVFSYKDISFASGGTQEDFILEYNAGKNFSIKGFGKLFFLPDYSTDFKTDSQPVFYTHNPSLPSVLQGFLIELSFDVFQSRVFYAIISLVGIAFLYLFISAIASVPAAVFTSLFLVLNFSGFLSLADHSQYSLSFPILFGYLWLRYTDIPKKYLIISSLFFVAVFANFMLAAFMLILEVLLGIFEKNMKLSFLAFLAVIGGSVIHIIQNMIALTPFVAFQDIWLTIQNRFFSIPSRMELLGFYQANDIVLWGSNASPPLSNYLSGTIPFYLFKIPLTIGIIFTSLFYIFRQGIIYKNIKFITPLFFSVFIWQTIFLPTIGNHPLFFHAFMVIFLGLVLGDLFRVLIENIDTNNDFIILIKEILFKIIIFVAMILIVLEYFTWAAGISQDERLPVILATLENYQDKTFFTNITPNTVSFKTGAWSVGFCLPDGLIDIDASNCYSKFSGLSNEKLIPDYILLSSYAYAFECSRECFFSLKNKLIAKYELVEEINNGEDVIYKVKK
ncbi:MAG: hypothetical protein NUV64_00455 [Parcubacteria group bacterium]|nr:hypothetical protein [Parcubacteria group bacterium]MCR4342517.1 hypothetical protein [Patescibacteria group bacterium]